MSQIETSVREVKVLQAGETKYHRFEADGSLTVILDPNPDYNERRSDK